MMSDTMSSDASSDTESSDADDRSSGVRRASCREGSQTVGTGAEGTGLELLVVSPPGTVDPAMAIAGSRAGAVGVLNLEFASDPSAALAALAVLATQARGRCGVLLDGDGPLVEPVLRAHPSGLDVVVLSAGA